MNEQLTLVLRLNHLSGRLVRDHPYLLQNLVLRGRKGNGDIWGKVLILAGARLRSLTLFLHPQVDFQPAVLLVSVITKANLKRVKKLVLNSHLWEHHSHLDDLWRALTRVKNFHLDVVVNKCCWYLGPDKPICAL